PVALFPVSRLAAGGLGFMTSGKILAERRTLLRKFSISMVATTLATVLRVGGLASAAAKPLGCIRNYNACMRDCQGMPWYDWYYGFCANGCWNTHAACVDAAFSFARAPGKSAVVGARPRHRVPQGFDWGER